MKLLHLRPLALSVAALLVTAPAAFALDADDFADKLVDTWTAAAPGLTVKLLGGTVTGNNISYPSVSVLAPAAGAEPVTEFIKIDFINVVEQPGGGYTADAMMLPDYDFKSDNGDLSVKNTVFHHLFLPAGKPTVLDSSRIFGDASVGPIVLTVEGTPALTIDSIAINQSYTPGQSDPALAEIDSSGVTSGLKFDMTHAKDQDAVAQATALGLQTLTGKALESTNWSLKDGHLNIAEVSLAFDNVGKIKFGFDITGYTPAFVENLVGASQTLVAGSDPQASQIATAKLLQASQNLFLNSASIRYDDASLAGKLLDLFAKQSGVTRAALVNQLVAAIPQMDEGSSDPTPPAVLKMMQAAARAFLNDPHSIEVKLAPKAPLGILGIVAAAVAPANLADQIGLQVNVNDKQITQADADKETGVAPPATDTTQPAPSDDSTTAAPDDDSGDQTTTDDGEDNGATDDSSGDSRLQTPHSN